MEITLFTRRRPSAACLHLPWAGRPRWSDLPSDLSSGGEHLWTPSVRPRPRLILTYHSSWWSQSVPDQGWEGFQSCHGSFWKNWFRCTTWIQRENCEIYWLHGFKYREDFLENYPQNVSKIPCFSSGLGRCQRGRREVEINNLHLYIYCKRNKKIAGHHDCEGFLCFHGLEYVEKEKNRAPGHLCGSTALRGKE